MLRVLSLISVLILSFSNSFQASAGNDNGQNRRYAVKIDVRKAYVSGICILRIDEDMMNASIINEFGLSTLSFRYDIGRGKVKITGIIRQLDKGPVRKMLKKDLKVILGDLHSLPEDRNYEYDNPRSGIRYSFRPVIDK